MGPQATDQQFGAAGGANDRGALLVSLPVQVLDNGKLRVEQVELYAADDAEDVARAPSFWRLCNNAVPLLWANRVHACRIENVYESEYLTPTSLQIFDQIVFHAALTLLI